MAKWSGPERGAIGWIGRVAVLTAVLAALPLAGLTASDDVTEGEELVDSRLLETLDYRLVGPFRGGRSTAVTGVASDPHTFFMGTTGGGVWKTTNAGTSWSNLTDGFLPVGSIGAIAVAPSDENVIYVGTGSACPRGNISVGKGMFRSTDGGSSWSSIGLERAGLIGRVRVHPQDPDTLWVAVLGQIFGPNEERGVYRSRDGGATWERVLHSSENTGAVDLSLDPGNPRVLYAAMWTAERKPWTLIDGGEESGLYKTTDGGDHWERLEEGLPGGVVGRIGVTVSPQRPQRVWALVTADEGRGGVFRSEDGGKSWKRVSTNRDLQSRGWYYSHIYADPHDVDTVWVMNAGFFKSIDGGAKWERVSTPHGDNHDLWIHPIHPEIMVEANDGGANVSLDGGESWSTQFNQPTAEFYRVTTDSRFPYRLYGAQQDNTTISVPSRSPGGITPKQHWYSVAGAESGHIAVHPDNPDLVYSGNYLGRIDRYDHETGYSQNVILYPQMQDGTAPRDLRYRFQWNAPILISRHDHDVVYHASNYVHRTRDGGVSWETISPDLTRNDPEKQALPGGPVQHDHTGVEVYNTVFALAESPLEADVLWSGSDDGKIHVSRDDGDTWRDVTPPGMPLDATVNSIDVSSHRPGRTYVAAYRYRNDDWRPYIFKTDDWGESWVSLSEDRGIPEDWPVRVVREDPDREGLLYAGTEFGLFVSFDDGAHWQSLQLDLPRTPITDLQVVRQDLVVATQGRSFWILDDLTTLHQLTPGLEDEPVHLFAPRSVPLMGGRGFRGEDAPERAPRGAAIRFWLAQELGEEDTARLEILDPGGEVVRRFVTGEREAWSRRWGRLEDEELELEQGMNHFTWDLMYPGPELVEGAIMSLAYTGGLIAPPGEYEVRLTLGDEVRTTTVELYKDPRLADVSDQDLRAKFELGATVRDRLTGIHDHIWTLRSIRQQSESMKQRGRDAGLGDADLERLENAVEQLADEITSLEEEMIQTRNEVGQDPINFPPKIDDQYAYLYSHIWGGYTRPTPGTYQRLEDLDAEYAPLEERYRVLREERLTELVELVKELGLSGIVVPSR